MSFVFIRDSMGQLVLPPPCGKCDACRFAAEVNKMLDFVDRRMLPAAREHAQRIADLRWDRADDRHLRQVHRAFKRAKDEWLEARSRVMTPEVVNASTCLNTGAIAIGKAAEVEPPEVDAIPSSHLADLREIARTMPHPGQCCRCGKPLDRPPIMPLEVCGGCFGKEIL